MDKMKKIVLVFLLLCSISYTQNLDKDTLLLEAIGLAESGKYKEAQDIYLLLFEESNKSEYIKESAILSSILGQYEAALDFALQYIAHPNHREKSKRLDPSGVIISDDLIINQLLVDIYINLGDSKKAKDVVLYLKEKDKDYEHAYVYSNALGNIYILESNLPLALKELQIYYDATHEQETLQKIVTLYLYNKKPNTAMEVLHKHLQKYGCSGDFCKFSAGLYATYKEIAMLEDLFNIMYKKEPTIANATNLIFILSYQKKYEEAKKIAEKYPLNREILLQLYIATNDFAKASNQAYLIYKQTNDAKLLALSLMYKYEVLSKNGKIRLSKDDAIKFAKELDEALVKINNDRLKILKNQGKNQISLEVGYYANFYGFFLIDYDIDVNKGMEYVSLALSSDPNNEAFLDSLGWGYYKKRDCKNAKATFEKLRPSKDDEIQNHILEIDDKCSF